MRVVGGSGGGGVDGILGPEKRSSIQALEIERARDLVDEGGDDDDDDDFDDDDDDYHGRKADADGNDDDPEANDDKPVNLSLYIMGEYDILNDLVYDGARRLRENANATDLDLLRQNMPCPPPDRWVRPTGWGRCNPSSMYAKDPPPDFDWVRYYDRLRLRTGPYANSDGKSDDGGGRRGHSTRSREVVGRESGGIGDDINVAPAEPQDVPLQVADGNIRTATDASSPPIETSPSDLSCDERHRVNGRLTMVCRAGCGAAASLTSEFTERPASASASASAVRGGGRGGASSHFNRSATSLPVRNAPVRSSWQTVGVGANDDAPRASSERPAGTKSRGFGRKMSSLFGGGRKKSTSAE
ncbi:hypothetical protein ACHAXA_000752 [Cyclostephanos tholiformis]|uniref:Uncharacterized protein n=1 Tax=Cyclostephanos tholiformis TaxID=382380 RepID=A0ABD3RQY8_9STRA